MTFVTNFLTIISRYIRSVCLCSVSSKQEIFTFIFWDRRSYTEDYSLKSTQIWIFARLTDSLQFQTILSSAAFSLLTDHWNSRSSWLALFFHFARKFITRAALRTYGTKLEVGNHPLSSSHLLHVRYAIRGPDTNDFFSFFLLLFLLLLFSPPPACTRKAEQVPGKFRF